MFSDAGRGAPEATASSSFFANANFKREEQSQKGQGMKKNKGDGGRGKRDNIRVCAVMMVPRTYHDSFAELITTY